MNARLNCVEGSRYLQSLFLAPASNSMLIRGDVGFTGSHRKDVAAAATPSISKPLVSPQRFRQELAAHTVAIRNQNANALRQLRNFC